MPERGGSPPTRRVVAVLDALAGAAARDGATSAELARHCGITTSTCALILAELEDRGFVSRAPDRRYRLGAGLFGLVRALRERFPLFDEGHAALADLHAETGAGCSLAKIDPNALTVIDVAGHAGEFVPGHQFPLDPPFGSVAMAWHGDVEIDRWLGAITPRLSQTESAEQRRTLAEIRARGYGAWRLDRAQPSLRERLTAILDVAGPSDGALAQQLTQILTMVSLQSVTSTLEAALDDIEFLVVPVFLRRSVPDYQIQLRIDRAAGRSLSDLERLEAAIDRATGRLRAAAGIIRGAADQA